MLSIHSVTKSYETNPVLKDITFAINPGDRMGLIGPNGSGKSTLCRLLVEQEAPDEGVIIRTLDLRIGYLSQGFHNWPGETIEEAVRATTGDLQMLENELEQLAIALSGEPENQKLFDDYDLALRRLQDHSPAAKIRSEEILSSLGLSEMPVTQPIRHLSGGQKTRLGLALTLIQNPTLLILDEPTNHLDIEMLEWLENWITAFTADQSHAALIISHDRTFLDNTVNQILYLDPETHSLRQYAGNFTAYLDQYLAEHQRMWDEYRDQETEIRRIKQDIQRTKQQSLQVELTTTPRQPGVRRYAKKVARKAKSREKKLDRYLASEHRVDKPKESWQMKLDFNPPDHLGQDVLNMHNLMVGYMGHPALLTDLNLSIQMGERVVLSGANGSGKTSLIRTITGDLPPMQGSLKLGASIKAGYMAQEQESLDLAQSALELIQSTAQMNETEARSFLHYFLFSGDDPLRPAGELSFGERARLELARLVASGSNFLILDEPINHLDIPSRQRFEQALNQFQGAILAVIHDRYFIERFATRIWHIEGGKIKLT